MEARLVWDQGRMSHAGSSPVAPTRTPTGVLREWDRATRGNGVWGNW